MPQYTIPSCFSSYLLPHVLFVDDFAKRQKIAMVCCLAWNIGLFPDSVEREQHIDRVWKMAEADNPGVLPPVGMEQGFKQEVQGLVEQKRDLFPRILTAITKADLRRTQRHDILRVETAGSGEEIPLAINPCSRGLPAVVEVLKGIRRDTASQVELLEQVRLMPAALDDIMRTQMERAYAMQRASLVGFFCILTHWKEIEPGPNDVRVIDSWLAAIEEVEHHTKAILAFLDQ
jgi:hypothetical protein